MHAATRVAICRQVFTLIHGRDGAAPSLGQKVNTRSASRGAWIPVKRALCNIPAFVTFWLRHNRVSGRDLAISGRAPPIRVLLHRLPSRLSHRLLLFSVIIHEGNAPSFSRAKTLNIGNRRTVYWQKSIILFSPSYTKAFASLLIPRITMISACPGAAPG
jgi:hypothetical protein